MNKKNADREKDEDEDLDDEDEEDEDEDEEEEEEEEQPVARARVADARKERPRARPAADDHDHDHDDDHDGHDDDASDDEDPYWWTPHAVMSVLVLTGVLGFFGVFNRVLGFVPPVVSTEEKAADKPAAVAAAPARPPEQREEFGARHLLVQYKGAMRAPASITRTEEEAKARATEAMKKAKSGTSFDDLVREYSDEPNAANRPGGPGDLGKFRKGQMVPEFQNAVEKLKVGEISDLVKTPFGYHVIKRTQ